MQKIKNAKLYLFLLFLGIIFFAFSSSNALLADEAGTGATTTIANPAYSLNLDQATIAKGYTVGAFGLKLSLVPGILSGATGVTITKITDAMPDPWKLDRESVIYQFEFSNKAAYDVSRPFYIQFAYDANDNDYKQVYFFDKNYDTWRPLPTRDFPGEKFVRSLIHLPYARIAVFSYPKVIISGTASWYGYKGGNYAASPDFPAGSRLRVYNTADDSFVDVVINDFGPNRSQYPNRVLDMDKVAFQKIGALSDGVIDIRIEPLSIAADADGRIMGVGADGIGTGPQITVKAAIVKNEQSGEVYYSKAATSSHPLASLSKLVAMKVFLDTRPSLNQVVAYKYQDEAYNYDFCKPWESAKLTIADGDTLTIENLIYTSLVGSTNNTIESLVRVSGLPRDEFIRKMNATVASWGASTTHFVEPTGLSPENVSSPSDYAIIMSEVYKNPLIQKASTMPEYTFTTVALGKYHHIKNTDKLINATGYNITGSKTGYLDEAGYCLALRAKTAANQDIIVVTFGATNRNASFSESEELLQYGIRLSGN